eukprot:TRINITY_DN132_c0_g1_i1.p1 TRINITY_DN132_c0_g1~~TRINITY_DN132_c0_g1_i1.p1  ORF type:complete len:744 (-),score=173.80 TRINITY_DN132_c0_g1_i1:395-2626(-)
MALRDLVVGNGGCSVPGAPSSSSNPIGGLVDSIIGSSAEKRANIRELPAVSGAGPSRIAVAEPLTSLPGFEEGVSPLEESDNQVAGSSQNLQYDDVWHDSKHSPPIPFPAGHGSDYFPEFDQIYNQGITNIPPQYDLNGTPQKILSHFLRSFVDSSKTEIPFIPAELPRLGLSEGDKRCIRDRTSIMARHFFANKSDEYINAQVNALLQSLDIETDLRSLASGGSRSWDLEEYWKESQVRDHMQTIDRNDGVFNPAQNWVEEYSKNRSLTDPMGSWTEEFEQSYNSNSWAEEFDQHQAVHLRNRDVSNVAAMEQSRMLAHTLSQNSDPKFQNSKFLQFVSKMSRGELSFEGNQVKPVSTDSANGWADEYHLQHDTQKSSWANEFTSTENSHSGDAWISEFEKGQVKQASSDDWINEFSKMNMQDWGDEYASADGWADSYETYLKEQLKGEHELQSSARSIYTFAEQNPYVGHTNPLKEGQELFRKGLLSEAVLALEAEVLKNPENAEGWRLLGITHAENDDDQQAIASMVRAKDADPTNLEVLLALGVSHTNELEQAAALGYLRSWLQYHPKYGVLVPQDHPESLSHIEVVRLFNEAAQMSPEDGDVHTVLGVLYNLSREYDKAVQAFQTALKLKPLDYSLWNKLGATQANSAQSAEALYAYQQALNLKPNYVRAWANMGISFANQGRYEESIQYYVRALSMNPKAENGWQYLRISLSCASRSDLLEACDMRDLDTLQKEFPL